MCSTALNPTSPVSTSTSSNTYSSTSTSARSSTSASSNTPTGTCCSPVPDVLQRGVGEVAVEVQAEHEAAALDLAHDLEEQRHLQQEVRADAAHLLRGDVDGRHPCGGGGRRCDAARDTTTTGATSTSTSATTTASGTSRNCRCSRLLMLLATPHLLLLLLLPGPQLALVHQAAHCDEAQADVQDALQALLHRGVVQQREPQHVGQEVLVGAQYVLEVTGRFHLPLQRRVLCIHHIHLPGHNHNHNNTMENKSEIKTSDQAFIHFYKKTTKKRSHT
jgi:hypothetical protein